MTSRARLSRLPWHLRYAVIGRAASNARLLGARVSHLHANLMFERPVWIGPRFALRMFENGSTLRVGAGTEFRRDFTVEVAGTGEVVIGRGCTFAGAGAIQATTSISIGDGAIFAQGVVIVDGNHRFRDHELTVHEQGYDFRPISIGPGALVLANSTITNDVGERAVIGANSVVTRPIPPFSLAVGAPARVVEYFGPPDREPRDTGP